MSRTSTLREADRVAIREHYLVCRSVHATARRFGTYRRRIQNVCRDLLPCSSRRRQTEEEVSSMKAQIRAEAMQQVTYCRECGAGVEDRDAQGRCRKCRSGAWSSGWAVNTEQAA